MNFHELTYFATDESGRSSWVRLKGPLGVVTDNGEEGPLPHRSLNGPETPLAVSMPNGRPFTFAERGIDGHFSAAGYVIAS